MRNLDKNIKIFSAALITTSLLFVACAKKPDATDTSASASSGSSSSTSPTTPSTPAAPQQYIYVASGNVYAGLGVVTSTASNTIAKYSLSGQFVGVVKDYTMSPGDSPVHITNYNNNYLLVLVDNASGRRVELVAKDGSSSSTLVTNATALSATMRALAVDYSGGLLISKSTAIEKLTTNGTRVTIAGNPYVNNPAGTCATMTNILTDIVVGPANQIITANAFSAASTNNRLAMISNTGYVAASDCIASIAAPTINNFPTGMTLTAGGNLLVAYSNNTGPVNEIWSYPITANAFGTPVKAYSDASIIQSVSRMALMPDGSILAANANSSFNTVEKFTYDGTTQKLTRVGTSSLINPSIYTKSISGLVVGY